jgi:hypothetical protein
LSKKFGVVFMYLALGAIFSAVLLAGCSSGSSSQTAAPAAQTQQQPNQSTQPQTNSPQSSGTSGQQSRQGQGQQNMQQVITRAAAILGVSATDLTTAFNAAIKSAGGDRPGPGSGSENRTRPSGQPPQGGQQSGQRPSQGQTGQGQPPSGSSDMMKSVYASIATTLNLSADKVQAAFEQAQSELKQ